MIAHPRRAVERESVGRVMIWYVWLAIGVFCLMQLFTIAKAALLPMTLPTAKVLFLGWYVATVVSLVVLAVRYPSLSLVTVGSLIVLIAVWLGYCYPVGSPLVHGYAVFPFAYFWMPGLLMASGTSCALARIWRRIAPPLSPELRCIECGYPRKVPSSVRCPECGHEYPRDLEIWTRSQR